jgi:hypothetical protein
MEPVELVHIGEFGDGAIVCVYKTLQQFQVDSSKVGYFVLDNAYANDSAIAKLADMYQFDRLHLYTTSAILSPV